MRKPFSARRQQCKKQHWRVRRARARHQAQQQAASRRRLGLRFHQAARFVRDPAWRLTVDLVLTIMAGLLPGLLGPEPGQPPPHPGAQNANEPDIGQGTPEPGPVPRRPEPVPRRPYMRPSDRRRMFAEARARARAAHAARCKAAHKPWCSQWPSHKAHLKRFTAACKSFIRGMACCALCGSVAFGPDHDYSLVPKMQSVPLPPAFFMVPHLLTYMVGTPGGPDDPVALVPAPPVAAALHTHWRVCPACNAPATIADRMDYSCTFTAAYCGDVLRTPPLTLQLMSLVDLRPSTTRKFKGFLHGSITRQALIGPLLAGDPSLPVQCPPTFQSVMTMNLAHNPPLQSFLTVLEQARCQRGIPV